MTDTTTATASTAGADRVLTRQGRDRRDDLLAHAERLILERGVAGTRMVDIARAAGVAKGLVYWYFDSKDALLLAIAHDVRERLRATQTAAVESLTAPLDQLYVGTVVSVRFVHEHWNLFRVLQTEVADAHGDLLGESSRIHALDTVAIVEAGQADGSIRADEEPLVLAHGNQGIVNHMVLAAVRGHLTDVESAAHAAARLAVHAAAASPEVARAAIDRCATARPRPT